MAFLAVSNLFHSSKIDFWPFLKLQKMKFGQTKFREIDLFDFTSFFGLNFFKFFCPPLCVQLNLSEYSVRSWNIFGRFSRFNVQFLIHNKKKHRVSGSLKFDFSKSSENLGLTLPYHEMR